MKQFIGLGILAMGIGSAAWAGAALDERPVTVVFEHFGKETLLRQPDGEKAVLLPTDEGTASLISRMNPGAKEESKTVECTAVYLLNRMEVGNRTVKVASVYRLACD